MFNSESFDSAGFNSLLAPPVTPPVTPPTPPPTVTVQDPPPEEAYEVTYRGDHSVMGRYQYLLYINGVLSADLTGICEDRTFTITRNEPDEIEFALNLDKFNDLSLRLHSNAQDLLQVGVAEIRVVRRGVVVTAGQIMAWDADLGDTRKITVHAKGWSELLKYRLTNSNYDTPTTALAIAQSEINLTQARPFGSFGYVLGAAPSPDTTNSYTSKKFENKSVYDVFTELSEEQGGFDYEVTWDKKMNIYSAIGIQRSEVVLTYPGNLKNVRLSNDSTRLVNALTARGSGYGDTQLSVAVSDTGSQQVYAIRESTLDFSDITDQTQLTKLANSELETYKKPTVIHDVVFIGGVNGAPEVGVLHVGDRIPIIVKTLQLYADVDKYFRIDKISVNLSNEDEEEVTLSFTE